MISEITKRLRLNGQTWIKYHKMPNSSLDIWGLVWRTSNFGLFRHALWRNPRGGGIWISTPKRGGWKPTENNGNCPCVCWWKNRQVTGDASVSVRKGREAQQSPVTRLRWGPSVKTTFESSNFRNVLYIFMNISWISIDMSPDVTQWKLGVCVCVSFLRLHDQWDAEKMKVQNLTFKPPSVKISYISVWESFFVRNIIWYVQLHAAHVQRTNSLSIEDRCTYATSSTFAEVNPSFSTCWESNVGIP